MTLDAPKIDPTFEGKLSMNFCAVLEGGHDSEPKFVLVDPVDDADVLPRPRSVAALEEVPPVEHQLGEGKGGVN